MCFEYRIKRIKNNHWKNDVYFNFSVVIKHKSVFNQIVLI